jgi:predicted nuclease of predicted toxin-antitoxin system
VRILLDEQLPRQFARELRGHQARTVQQQGWAGLTNGELLRRAAADGFEIFITADRNLQFQQNLRGSPLGVIVLVAPSNALEDLLPLVPGVLNAVTEVRPGEIRPVSVSRD